MEFFHCQRCLGEVAHAFSFAEATGRGEFWYFQRLECVFLDFADLAVYQLLEWLSHHILSNCAYIAFNSCCHIPNSNKIRVTYFEHHSGFQICLLLLFCLFRNSVFYQCEFPIRSTFDHFDIISNFYAIIILRLKRFIFFFRRSQILFLDCLFQWSDWVGMGIPNCGLVFVHLNIIFTG